MDTEDATEDPDVTEAVVLCAEADDKATSSVADGETVAAVVLESSCRGSGRATPARTMLKHNNKQRRALHVPGVGVTRILQRRRPGTGAPQRPFTFHARQCRYYGK